MLMLMPMLMQAVPTILSNRRAGGSGFGARIAGRVPLAGMSSRLLDDRMRPLVTGNGHGINPVFCIKFDRTGQYIFTGADDMLVKVHSSVDNLPVPTAQQPNSPPLCWAGQHQAFTSFW